RLVSFGMVRIGRLDVSCFSQLPPPQVGDRLDVGDDLLAERLALNQSGEGETAQGGEPHDALRTHVLVGHAPTPFPPPQENTGYSLERMSVKPGGRRVPAMHYGAFSPPFCKE